LCICALACGGPGAARHDPAVASATPKDDFDKLHGKADRCPEEAEDEDGFADHDGCPDNDNDGDKIVDWHDLCPNESEDVDGFEDSDGCPDPDNDQDRILDEDDDCPLDAETYNGADDDDGCPDKSRIVVTELNCFPMIDRIYFQPNSTRLSEIHQPLLDAIAATIDGNPDIDLAAVVGNAASNEKKADTLGLARAEAVASALVARGIDPNRLKVVSSGDRAPIGQEDEKNRRVDFHILDGRDGAVGYWDGDRVVPVDH
jgi:outer membrane protein OmpA-like peptidoglycan-associated protein